MTPLSPVIPHKDALFPKIKQRVRNEMERNELVFFITLTQFSRQTNRKLEKKKKQCTFPVIDSRSNSSSLWVKTEEMSELESETVEFPVSWWSLNRNLEDVEEDSMGIDFPSNEHNRVVVAKIIEF